MSASAISCSGPGFCAVAGGLREAKVVTFNGSTWSRPLTLGGDGTYLIGMSCPTAQFCAAADSGGQVVTFDGSAWSALTRTALTGGAVSLSCPTSKFCAMVSYSGQGVFFTGSHWSAATTVDPLGNPAAVSCASPGLCALVDDLGNAFW
jgi:hypothetical protein